MPKPSPIRYDARPTQAQIDYLEILFNDCGFNRLQRNDFLTLRVGREIRALDELTKAETSRFIGNLKERKENVQEGMSWEGNEDE